MKGLILVAACLVAILYIHSSSAGVAPVKELSEASDNSAGILTPQEAPASETQPESGAPSKKKKEKKEKKDKGQGNRKEKKDKDKGNRKEKKEQGKKSKRQGKDKSGNGKHANATSTMSAQVMPKKHEN